MKGSTIKVTPYRHHSKRKSRTRHKKVHNHVDIHPDSESVGFAYS